MALDTGDRPVESNADNSTRSALSDEYIQLAKANTETDVDLDCSSCSDTKSTANIPTENLPNIEQMKELYPVIGPSLDRYQELVNGNDPSAYLEAEPDFRKNVTESDTSFQELEKSMTAQLEEMGPELPQFKKEFLARHEAFNSAWEALPASTRLDIRQKAGLNQIPISEAAEGHPEVVASAKAVETFFSDNIETQMKLTKMQGELTNSYQQRIFAREMHGDTLLHGSQASNNSVEMLLQKDAVAADIDKLYTAGVPNIFDYIKDE